MTSDVTPNQAQRMLVGVSKRMAAEFFDNVEAVLTSPAVGAGASLPVDAGAVFTAPGNGASEASGPSFARGVAVGAAAALAGALVGAWISRRRG